MSLHDVIDALPTLYQGGSPSAIRRRVAGVVRDLTGAARVQVCLSDAPARRFFQSAPFRVQIPQTEPPLDLRLHFREVTPTGLQQSLAVLVVHIGRVLALPEQRASDIPVPTRPASVAAARPTILLREAAPPDLGLTTRQYQVALFVTRGLSNNAIARELGVTSRTVANHLGVIFAQLGVASRVELGQLVLRELDA